MREIKFLAAVIETGEVFPVLTIWNDSVCLDTTNGRYEWNSYVFSKEKIQLLQFTGMQDINGQEIYEGNIIRRNFEVGNVTYNEVTLGADGYDIIDAGHFIGVVRYRPSAGFILNQCRKYNEENELISKQSGVRIHPQYAEVIGNIYENPELLEE